MRTGLQGLIGMIILCGGPLSGMTPEGDATESVVMQHSSKHDMHAIAAMHGMYGSYPMHQEASGTSWVPASMHMPGLHRTRQEWSFMLHGYINGVYDHQGGSRGRQDLMSQNMFMATGQKDFGKSTFAFRTMMTLEPGTVGPCGYPLLLQTGETCDGVSPLIDRQHPHDFLMELALAYGVRFSEKCSIFAYFGLPGEPALGPSTFMHRFSALYNPEAPITHHWLDSTHITFGVATLGCVYSELLKVDASLFTGREPDQCRWNFDKPRFDSYAVRISFNPTENMAFQVSHGFIKSPEQLHHEVDTHRTTASFMYNRAYDTTQWQTTVALGANENVPGNLLYGLLLESTVALHAKNLIFGRAEYVEKDELFVKPNPCAEKVFKVGKIALGYARQFSVVPCVTWEVGGVASVSLVPDALRPVYGGRPWSCMLFVRATLGE